MEKKKPMIEEWEAGKITKNGLRYATMGKK
jgi:hypothetical protein